MRCWVAGACLLFAASAAMAGQARYIVKAHLLPESRAVNGYVQQVMVVAPGRAKVDVTTSIDPIGATGFEAGWPKPTPGTPAWFRLPVSLDRLLATENDPWERATRVLRWVMDHVRVDPEERQPQDATSVLERGSGRCSGLANAAAALLRSAGFCARTVSGVLVTKSGFVPHRWLECKLPGAGWVPTDPTLGLWVVTPRHVAFPRTVNGKCVIRPLGEARDGLGHVASAWGWPVRWNRGAVLRCRVVGGDPTSRSIVAELRGPDGELRRLHVERGAQFRDLAPGRWFLTVRLDGRVVDHCSIELREGRTLSYAIRIGEPEVG